MTINTDTPAELTIALDDRVALMRELIQLQDLEEQNKRRQAQIKRELKGIIPLGFVATVGGTSIYKHSRTDQFADAKFRDEEPDWHGYFTQQVKKPVLNLAALREELPQAWDTYRVAKLIPVGNRASFATVLGLPAA